MPTITNQAEYLTQFLQTQTRIRVVMDDAGNFGNQASSFNLMQRIRSMGFRGLFEVVYFAGAKNKIFQLFHLQTSEETVFYSKDHGTAFIERDYFIKLLEAGNITKVTLGVTGATDLSPDAWGVNSVTSQNFADALNVDGFVRFSPYYNMDDMCNTEIYLRGADQPIIQQASCQNMLITPIANLAMARYFLQYHPIGKMTLQTYPALSSLIARIDDQSINFQSLYGWTYRESPSNLLNAVLGAAYAQAYGGSELQKPLIIGAFFELDRPSAYHAMNGKNDIKNSDIFNGLVWNDDWDLYNTAQGAAKVKESIKTLSLRERLRILTLDDPKTAETIASLKQYEILLISIPKMSKMLFDGIFTHHGKNILPPGREGAGSLTSLLSVTGRPHLHCRSEFEWEINFELATPAMQESLRKLNSYICPQKFYEDLKFTTWKTVRVDEAIGKFIIASHNFSSPVSTFFARLKDDALRPANDRILLDLHDATKLIETRRKQLQEELLSPSLWTSVVNSAQTSLNFMKNYIFSWLSNKSTATVSSMAIQTRISNTSQIHRQLHAAQGCSIPVLDYVLSHTANYANDVVESCPSYFPPTQIGASPHYWSPQPTDSAVIGFTASVAPISHFPQISM